MVRTAFCTPIPRMAACRHGECPESVLHQHVLDHVNRAVAMQRVHWHFIDFIDFIHFIFGTFV